MANTEILDIARQALASLASPPPFEVALVAEPGLPPCSIADPDMLREALAGLLNRIAVMPPEDGRITLVVSRAAGGLRFAAANDGMADGVVVALPTFAARILLVDDLDLNRRLLADMLSIDGHAVDCVAGGPEALAAVGDSTYDLILMDVVMPGMSGLEATRLIRALPGPSRTIPILALTANAFDDQHAACLAAGMDATLVKPLSIDTLSAAVAGWIGRRHPSPPETSGQVDRHA